MYRDVEVARSGVAGAIQAEGWPQLLGAAAGMCRGVVAQAIQVHGGIGFTWELGLHSYLKHVLAVQKVLMALGSAGTGG
jgi:alkylation response protein AidB-like acyl-CoA dehydrogenase